ncbi:hypothetical protein BVC93_03305 [Mycobacterium sp. MS1601]|nr:hypothetical protein BVC93_03305 [Mycobacterium sp. MS1601]
MIRGLGGASNIRSLTHCTTRLRVQLANSSSANPEEIQALPGVLTVVESGGQFQVVVGQQVEQVYADIKRALGISQGTRDTSQSPGTDLPAPQSGGGVLAGAIALISAIVRPLIWPLAGMGLFKALLTLVTIFGWLDPESQTATVLSASADALFFFLPIFVAVTCARRFQTNEFTSMIIAGALVYPSITAIADQDPTNAVSGVPLVVTSFAGIPLVAMHYAYSVVPIVAGVWIQSHLESRIQRAVPLVVRAFMTPFLVVLIMVPLILITVGPLTTLSANAISGGISIVWEHVPWLAGALLGGAYQVFVIFGLHWALDPIMIQEVADKGYSLLTAPLVPAVLAQAAAAIAVALRTRSAARREAAGAASLSGLLAGVTEPAIYGANLPLRRPFAFALIGGALGGAIVASGGVAPTAYIAFYSVLSVPAFLSMGSPTMLFLGIGVAMLTSFVLTFFFTDREQPDSESEETPPTFDTDADATSVVAPVAGRHVALAEVDDKVFSSGVMGQGFAIVPDDGHFVAPISGTLQVVMSSGHGYGIKSADGAEVLVHIGINTVQLEGAGFRALVDAGQQVRSGDPLAEVDLAAVTAAGFDTTTVVLVTNSKEFEEISTPEADRFRTGDRAMTIRRHSDVGLQQARHG